MIYITPQENIEEYFKSPALSQSQLKTLGQSLKAYQKEKGSTLYFEDTPEHFIIGSGVDCILTQGGREVFDEKYYVGTLEEKPSITMMSIVKAVFDVASANEEILELKEYKDTIIDSAKMHKWNSKYGDEALFNGVVREGTEYWNELVQAKGRQVISQQEFNTITSIADSLLSSSATSPYLVDGEDYDLFFQLPLYFMFDEVECKALLDIVKIYKDGRVEPVDLKTLSGPVTSFPESMRKRGYHIQGAWYLTAMQVLHFSLSINFPGCNHPKDFFIHPFCFIVESTTEIGLPAKFEMLPSLTDLAINGRETTFSHVEEEDGTVHTIRRKPILGINDLVDRYRWYEDNNFTLDYDYTVSEGNYTLDWDGILYANNEN